MVATDQAGNVSETVSDASTYFTLDTQVEDTQGALAATSDTGELQNDGITRYSDQQLSFTGTLEEGATVKLVINIDGIAYTVTPTESQYSMVDGKRVWTIDKDSSDFAAAFIDNDIENNSDGYSYHFEYEDVAGNVSSSQEQTLVIDTLAPFVTSLGLTEAPILPCVHK